MKRSDFFLMLGWDPMFWRLPQISVASLVRLQPVQYASSFSNDRSTLWRMPMTTHIFGHSPFLYAWHVGWFFFFRRTRSVRVSFSQGITFWRAGRSRTFPFPLDSHLVLWIVFHSTLSSLRALTFRRPLRATFTVFFFLLHLNLPLAASAPEVGFFKWHSDCWSWRKYTFTKFFVVWPRLHRDDGFVSSRDERVHVVILQFDLQNLIDVHNRLVCVADLDTLVDHPCDLPSLKKAFFLRCSFFSKKKLLLHSLCHWPSQSQEPRSQSAVLHHWLCLTSSARQ